MLTVLKQFRAPRAVVPPREGGTDATRTLDAILRAAANDGASDIHFEPKEDGLCIRFRLDGEMREHLRLPAAQREPLIARGKIFGGMDITEKRLPQDGRAVLREKDRRFHLRLSTIPTVHGESLVVRLLDQTMPGQAFSELGLAPPQAEALRQALAGPAGIIYLTGPTGSCARPPGARHPHAGGPCRI
jgi:type II secretory ATPase GspE/PulE/Tfp pilus assembly ATPase PilB-like protein